MILDDNNNISVYGIVDNQNVHKMPEFYHLSDEFLIDEIEERPTWNAPMSYRLQALSEAIWEQVRHKDSFYDFTAYAQD